MPRELTYIKRNKIKKVFQLTDQEFREGKWCADKEVVPDGNFVEFSYTSRNGILIVNNTTDFDIKSVNNKLVKREEQEVYENGYRNKE